ncbi:MAG: M42 family metallopeptidase [Thermodesulfobacteriota bacterium]|jgi:endoglucanase
MRVKSFEFLKALAEVPSPSGYEQPAQKLFRDYIRTIVDEVKTDVLGNTYGYIRGRGKKKLTVMLAGHCDEVGFMVKYIDDHGYAYFASIGGVDDQILPGKRVWIHSPKGLRVGVVGRKPIHLIDPKEREKVVQIHNLFIDFGAKDRKEAEAFIKIGDPITFAVGLERLMGDRVVSRGFDDKVGSFVVAEVLRQIGERKERPRCEVYGVSTVQEELGLRGATTSAYQIQPDIGIAVEVGHASDYPDVDKKRVGEYELGAGPIIARGANINPLVYELLVQTAKKMKIRVQILGAPRATGTDANVIQLSRKGVATGLVSVPLRYMHTPGEVLSLKDLEATCELLVGFIHLLREDMSFIPK